MSQWSQIGYPDLQGETIKLIYFYNIHINFYLLLILAYVIGFIRLVL